ncbi:MAG: SulP family inorganic anion transporter [Bryobacter sp.]|nr:SulP family inorganic anion transporter [Bryobacter sp.]
MQWIIRKYSYSWRDFAGDCFGGLIAALIALPYGLAMASLMGLPPVLGLFTSLLTAPITAFLGRNPVLIGGTSTVTVPFLALAVKQQGIGGAAKVTLVAAVFLLVFSVLRLGRHILRIPLAVVSGFSCGIGAMMVITQLKTIFGITLSSGSWQNTMFSQLIETLSKLDQAKLAPVVFGITVIAAAFGFARISSKLPAPLLGVITAIGLGSVLGLHEKEVGRLPLEIPPLAGFQWSAADVYTVLPSGFAMAFVVAINLLITSRIVEHFRGKHRHMKPSDADGELGAYGIANICAGIFGAPMSVGIPARSLANVRCGATTLISNLVHAIVLLICLSLGAAYVSHIPIPALAGVTAYVGILLLEWSTWRRLPKMRRVDAAAFLATLGSVLFLNPVVSVGLGCLCYGFHWAYVRFLAPQQQPAPSYSAE